MKQLTSNQRWLLAAVSLLLLAAAVRLIALHDLPPGIVRDETLNTDIARFIRAGRHALFFREGYGHEPLYHYLAAPFAPLIGDNVLAVRLPSVFIGLLLIAATLRWVRRDFGAPVALITATLLAVSWWPIVFSRIGLRPILMPLLLVAFAINLPKRPWLAGLALTAAVYTYTAARIIWLIPLLLFLWQRLTKPKQLSSFSLPFATFILPLLLSLPLYFTLRADPSLQQRVSQLSGPLNALRAGDAVPAVKSALATLGVFSFTGDPLSSYMLPNQPLFDPVTALFFYIGLAVALWRGRRQPTFALLIIWLAVTLLPSALAPDAPSVVRLIGSLPVVYLLPSLGLVWVKERLTRLNPQFSKHQSQFTLFVLALLILNAGRAIWDGRAWAALPDVRQKYQSIWLDIGRDWAAHGAPPLVVADSWYEPIKADSLRLDVGRTVAARWVQNGRALVLPAEPAFFYIPEFAPPDPHLLAAARLGQPEYRSPTHPAFARYQLIPAPLAIPKLSPAVPFNLPGQSTPAITLLGYTLEIDTAADQLTLITLWQVNSPLPPDLSTFLHLGRAGEVIAQQDGLDAIPDTLHVGDSFLQLHQLMMPADWPTSTDALILGLYSRQSGARLTHPGDPSDHLNLPLQGAVSPSQP